MTNGICTLGNDVVFDQIVALINSVAAHAGSDFPVCIYPYDDNLERLRAFMGDRPQVQIYDDTTSIQRWDHWVEKIWQTHPTAHDRWLAVNGKPGIHRMGTHRRFGAFDGPFDRFIYMDADTLLLDSPQPIFDYLDEFDWVTYDFQHKDLSHVFAVDAPQLRQVFSPAQIDQQIFCSGFYGSKRHSVDEADLATFVEHLSAGEAEVLYPMAPDQTILSYFVLRKPLKSVNLALHWPAEKRTGNSVTSPHFEERGDAVFDGDRKLLYLHYIGVSSKLFGRLCQGENMDIPYRDVFLHYRYLHAPDERPRLTGPKVQPQPSRPPLWKRALNKLKL
jgi:hypothetical protein